MNEQPELHAEARRWVDKAENDLRNAECVMSFAEDCPTDTVCFHCQQRAEKYQKALLISRGVTFPRTHDLVVLLNFAVRTAGLNLPIGQAQPLNRYSIEARYPGSWDPIDAREAAEALNMAKSVREIVRSVLSADVLR